MFNLGGERIMKLQKMKQSGFTLLELLVVVGILAIISGAVISAISGQEERAGQGVALNTMGALENAAEQHAVLNNGLPSGLDSLICADIAGLTEDANDTGDIATPAIMPTLADGLSGDLTLVNLPVPTDTDCDDSAEGACILTTAGMNSVRYAEALACNNDPDTATVNGVTGVGSDAANEVLANLLFHTPVANNAGEAAGGAGLNLPIDTTAVLPVLVIEDPTELGRDSGDVIAVFGVGNQSSFTTGNNRILARGPIDGNVEGDGERYSHFSLAIKIAEVDNDTQITTAGLAASAEWESDEVAVVAVLDSDGDYFDDEVAEFAGLEDE